MRKFIVVSIFFISSLVNAQDIQLKNNQGGLLSLGVRSTISAFNDSKTNNLHGVTLAIKNNSTQTQASASPHIASAQRGSTSICNSNAFYLLHLNVIYRTIPESNAMSYASGASLGVSCSSRVGDKIVRAFLRDVFSLNNIHLWVESWELATADIVSPAIRTNLNLVGLLS